MAKAKKAKRKTRAIVQGHLERINSQVFDNYKDQITDLIGKNHGVYALYRRSKLYYIGLAAGKHSLNFQTAPNSHTFWVGCNDLLYRPVATVAEYCFS